MSIQQQNYEENEELLDTTDNKLILLQGGNDGGGPWLGRLAKGTVFVCRQPRQQDSQGRILRNPFLQEFHVLWNDGNTVKLFNNLNEEVYTWVDANIFSELYSLVTIVGEWEDGPDTGTL